ncbi:hypothetical protein BT96DRAFT_880763 [Gymnopus androsaceus JB14]|uniref:Uncharacterized protein n=1 Tax=Gymnopus androsaceus JB14 TaxID=1447944 RepID=A0A6A4HPP5_9AGAR|nr:hypothetical protein BT96DRAFT_880763 [Gymnopus androsaceus JB14]
MSSTPTFPRRFPLDQRPPYRGTMVKGKKTPLYGLAWVRSPQDLSRNLGDISTGNDEYRDVIRKNWKGPHSLSPRAIYGIDGNYYLVAEWNQPHSELDLKEIVAAARKAMGVENDPTTDATLQWHWFPLTWVARDWKEREAKKHGLEETQDMLRDMQH